jgi:hypothetical protein
MDGMSVTDIWMAGVVGVMLVFGVIALIGIRLDQVRNKLHKQSSGIASGKND